MHDGEQLPEDAARAGMTAETTNTAAIKTDINFLFMDNTSLPDTLQEKAVSDKLKNMPIRRSAPLTPCAAAENRL